MTSLAEHGAVLLNGRLAGSKALGGGSLSQLVEITLRDGRRAVVKTGPEPRAEAAMLKAIRASGSPAPEVLAADDRVLVITLLPGSSGVGSAWRDLGHVLAHLHQTKGFYYGWERDYAFGAVDIVNRPAEDWPSFWGDHRLLTSAQAVGAVIARRLERLAADLHNRLPARPEPSLLHGDLWGGNVMTDGARVTGLIDPACYWGHGEVDIAMLMMFDRPDRAFFSAYGALEAGSVERLAIYRLWPALVHLRLFGDSYRALVEQLLDQLGV